MSELGQNVRLAREALGWSQQKLAEEAGVSQTTIDKIERGLTKRSRFLLYIARALRVAPDDLDRGSGSKRISAIETKELKQLGVGRDDPSHPSDKVPLFVPGLISKGDLLFPASPLDQIEAPPFLAGAAGAYAVYVPDLGMAPAFGPGDVVFVDPRLPVWPGMTCIFYARERPNVRVFRYMVEQDSDEWTVVANWNDEERTLSKGEWSHAHRVVAVYFRT